MPSTLWKTSVGNAHCRQPTMAKFPRRDVPISIMSPYLSPFPLQPSCQSQQLVRRRVQPGPRVHAGWYEAVHGCFSLSICNLADFGSVSFVVLLIARGKHFHFLLFSSYSYVTFQHPVSWLNQKTRSQRRQKHLGGDYGDISVSSNSFSTTG